jgi:hypothetical protein
MRVSGKFREETPEAPPSRRAEPVTTVIRPDVLGVHAGFLDPPGQVLPFPARPGVTGARQTRATARPGAHRAARGPGARGPSRAGDRQHASRPVPIAQALVGYASMSPRWLRAQLTDPHHPLPCYRLPGGKILVRRSEFDAWLARYRQVGDPNVERIVRDVLADLR